jgi:hypothetical protein
MDKGICILPLVPVRETPSDRSQMVNQLLFGDLILIKDRYKNWLFAETEHDGYAGWIDKKQIIVVSEEFFDRVSKEEPVFFAGKYAEVKDTCGNSYPLVMGSRLPLFQENQFGVGEDIFTWTEAKPVIKGKQPVHRLIKVALSYLGSPYLWGGRSCFGIDCSGFTQIVFRMCGYRLLRDASEQAELGTLVSFVDEARPGDLAFFEDEEGRIVHVGIVLKEQKIIHSSGKVRLDTLDHEGIFSQQEKKYTHKLRFIKRIIA